jgi:precorrin-6B C5,15-methyltransferase / cobalt-precorrin-6B C5,C15-methyltransferase
LTRIGLERLEPIGSMQGFAPARTVLQYMAVRP